MPLVMPFDFYDPIGNRTSATDYDEQGNPLVSSYSANALNQYTQRTVPGYAAIRGEAATNATVTVNERPVWRNGSYFYGGDVADNTDSSVFRELEVYAAINPSGTNTPDIVSATTGTVFIAKTPEQFTYDADGNMTSDGRFHYFWNGENRLVCASNSEYVVTYAYDHRGRMVRKEISRGGAEARRIEYLWDDWNIIRETITNLSTFQPFNHSTDYVWGLDLDGTLQGAGGVGGLLAVVRDDGVFFPTYDANGNVSEYVTTNGEIVAHYDYSPFGEPLVSSGDLAATFTHQFSTKPYCPVTEFSEYQMRTYRPEIGRWMSRDSIEEEGGLNLFGFNNNSPYIFIDNLGLHWMGGVHIVYPPFEPYCCIDNVIYVNEAVASGFKICKQYERNVGFFSGLLTHAWIETKKGNSYGFYPTITDFPKNDGFPAYRFIPSLVLSPDPYARKPKDGTITCTERYLSKCEYDFDRIEQCLKKAAKSTTKRYNVLAYNCLNWANETMNACIMEGRRKR